MIVFVPAFDPQTIANLEVARLLQLDACTSFLGEHATRQNLITTLEASPAPVFAMSHGKPHRLVDQDEGSAIDSGDLSIVGGRQLFIFACWTAGDLGAKAAANGATWWGYTGSIGAPDSRPEFANHFAALFEVIRGRFSTAHDASSRQSLILEIAELCTEYSEIADAQGDAHDALLSLLHIWQRLRVWVPGADQPEMHPAAPPPSILDESPSARRRHNGDTTNSY